MGDFNYFLVLPVIILSLSGLLSLLMAPGYRGQSRLLVPVPIVGIGFAVWATWQLWVQWTETGQPLRTAAGLVQIDGLGLFLTLVILLVAGLSVLTSIRFLEREHADHAEFYPLILFAATGMVVMVQTTNLIMVLVGLEVFSLALYVLTGLTRGRVRSVESALKYFLLGAFSSGFLVYGLALLYGSAGSLDMARIGAVAAAAPGPMLWIGMGLVLVGLAFKIAVVPFHQWVPDVYQGAPTNVTGFMAAATKTAAFAALLRFLVGSFGAETWAWAPLITWLAILTMTVGNLVALAQTNIKRLLAFSSIAHAGYLLIAVVCRPEDGVGAILFYLAAYGFMTVGAFAVAGAVGRGDERSEPGYDLASWAGLGRRRPALAAAMTVFLLSLAGMPPTGGFLGKYLVFSAAITSKEYLLAVVGILNAVVAAYYYLKIIVSMWMREADEEVSWAPVSASTAAALTVSVVVVFYLGLMPGAVLAMIRGLASSLL